MNTITGISSNGGSTVVGEQEEDEDVAYAKSLGYGSK